MSMRTTTAHAGGGGRRPSRAEATPHVESYHGAARGAELRRADTPAVAVAVCSLIVTSPSRRILQSTRASGS
jgi:hypothetical protein